LNELEILSKEMPEKFEKGEYLFTFDGMIKTEI
jgi:hypothetical protein